MTSGSTAQELRRLKSHLEEVHSQVVTLHWQRMVYRRVREIVAANPRINKPSLVYHWIGQLYAMSAAVAVRRLLDKNRRSISLATIVQRLTDNPALMTRRRFVSGYRKSMRDAGIADEAFDEFAGPGGQAVHPDILQRKLDEAVAKCAPIRKYVNKVVAHTDRARPAGLPKLADLTKAIDALGELLKELELLIRQVDLVSLEAEGSVEPLLPHDWDSVFREPWIRDD